ncbi:unnamed protein product [Amoebophrya sp. A120]|nr:unnamed protein product [Amoebophrya sp. A120]|eukprot:GSA120T00000084001.1
MACSKRPRAPGINHKKGSSSYGGSMVVYSLLPLFAALLQGPATVQGKRFTAYQPPRPLGPHSPRPDEGDDRTSAATSARRHPTSPQGTPLQNVNCHGAAGTRTRTHTTQREKNHIPNQPRYRSGPAHSPMLGYNYDQYEQRSRGSMPPTSPPQMPRIYQGGPYGYGDHSSYNFWGAQMQMQHNMINQWSQSPNQDYRNISWEQFAYPPVGVVPPNFYPARGHQLPWQHDGSAFPQQPRGAGGVHVQHNHNVGQNNSPIEEVQQEVQHHAPFLPHRSPDEQQVGAQQQPQPQLSPYSGKYGQIGGGFPGGVDGTSPSGGGRPISTTTGPASDHHNSSRGTSGAAQQGTSSPAPAMSISHHSPAVALWSRSRQNQSQQSAREQREQDHQEHRDSTAWDSFHEDVFVRTGLQLEQQREQEAATLRNAVASSSSYNHCTLEQQIQEQGRRARQRQGMLETHHELQRQRALLNTALEVFQNTRAPVQVNMLAGAADHAEQNQMNFLPEPPPEHLQGGGLIFGGQQPSWAGAAADGPVRGDSNIIPQQEHHLQQGQEMLAQGGDALALQRDHSSPPIDYARRAPVDVQEHLSKAGEDHLQQLDKSSAQLSDPSPKQSSTPEDTCFLCCCEEELGNPLLKFCPTCKAKIHGPCWAMYRQQQRSNPGGAGASASSTTSGRGGAAHHNIDPCPHCQQPLFGATAEAHLGLFTSKAVQPFGRNKGAGAGALTSPKVWLATAKKQLGERKRKNKMKRACGLLICSGGRGAACAGDVDRGGCDNRTMQSSGRRGWGVLEVEQQRASSGRNAATSQENLLLLQPKFRSLLAHNYRKILRDEERQQRGPRGILDSDTVRDWQNKSRSCASSFNNSVVDPEGVEAEIVQQEQTETGTTSRLANSPRRSSFSHARSFDTTCPEGATGRPHQPRTTREIVSLDEAWQHPLTATSPSRSGLRQNLRTDSFVEPVVSDTVSTHLPPGAIFIITLMATSHLRRGIADGNTRGDTQMMREMMRRSKNWRSLVGGSGGKSVADLN